MSVDSSSKRNKPFLQLVTDARSKGGYIRISRAEKNAFKRSSCVITGHKTMWSDGAKANPNFIYIPAISLAGESDVVTDYLKVLFNATNEGVRQLLDGALTINNYQTDTPVEVQWYVTDGSTADWKKITTTPREMFEAQMAEYENFRKSDSGQKGTASVPPLTTILASMNSVLRLFNQPEETVQRDHTAVSASKSKSKQLTTSEILSDKTNHLKDEQAILIGADSKDAPHGFTIRITKNVPKEGGIRFGREQKDIMYRIYFKTENSRVPEYVKTFLASLNYTNEQIDSFIGSLGLAHAGVGMSLPGSTQSSSQYQPSSFVKNLPSNFTAATQSTPSFGLPVAGQSANTTFGTFPQPSSSTRRPSSSGLPQFQPQSQSSAGAHSLPLPLSVSSFKTQSTSLPLPVPQFGSSSPKASFGGLPVPFKVAAFPVPPQHRETPSRTGIAASPTRTSVASFPGRIESIPTASPTCTGSIPTASPTRTGSTLTASPTRVGSVSSPTRGGTLPPSPIRYKMPPARTPGFHPPTDSRGNPSQSPIRSPSKTTEQAKL